jgi:EcsC family protein
MPLSTQHLEDLGTAKALLEEPGLAARVAGLIGMPIDRAMAMLPERWSAAVSTATRQSLRSALRLAVTTLDDRPQGRSRNVAHKLAVAATGAGGGAFGLAALPLELPVSTALMLRSIADIARSEGEVLAAPDAQLACLEVFAIGGRSSADDAAESSYFVVRAALARTVTDAARYVAERGIAEEGAPVLVRLLAQIASRFGLVVSQKAAAQAVPVVGAAAGGAINVLFMDHFQQLARGHFIVRRLERIYSPAEVKAAYEQLPPHASM